MAKPLVPFVCEYAGEVVTFTLNGELDHQSITLMIQRVESARHVVLDMTKAIGAYSTLISACIQLATRIGEPVTVRGSTKRFETTLLQMNLRRLIAIEGENTQALPGPSPGDITKQQRPR